MTVGKTSTPLKKVIKSSIIFVGALLCYLIISFNLVFWPTELPFSPINYNVNKTNRSAPLAPDGEYITILARDGESLYLRKIGRDSQRVIVFLHGI